MIQSIILSPISSIHTEITPPGSKSITNRALAIAAMAHGESILTGVLDSEDTRVMLEILRQMGILFEHDGVRNTITIHGTGKKRLELSKEIQPLDLYCGNSGTTLRFLTAMLANACGVFRLDGTERMRQRPVGDLLRGLRQLGVHVKAEFGNDCPPVLLYAEGILGGKAEIPGNISSQFLSGILMAAPLAQKETQISVTGTLVSRPYVDMTLAVMRAFGAEVEEIQTNVFRIPAKQKYIGTQYTIEPDASAASYFFAAVAVVGGEITIRGLSQNALQGDVKFCDCLARMGCEVEYLPDRIRVRRAPDVQLHGICADMRDISDTALTLAVTAMFADSPTTIQNVANMRVKETDRIRAVVTELRKFGVQVEEFDDGMRVHPLKQTPPPVEIGTYKDHRMAMSFAVAGLKVPGVTILDPACTAKTYPEFWEDLKKLEK